MHYYSFNDYAKKRFGKKVYKLSLSIAHTCPNRDGTVGRGGCIFCSGAGSGDFAQSADMPVGEQIERAKELIAKKTDADSFIAYFQSFTSTYLEPQKLRAALECALSRDDIVAVSVATRPDCLADDILAVLKETASKKPLFVELGLQSSKKSSVKYIRRGYENECYEKAVKELHAIGAEVITHMIIGLPGESTADMLNTADYIVHCGSDGIKLQLLHVLKGTDLQKDYESGKFSLPSLAEYIEILANIIERLPPDMVVHRITGDGPKSILIAPAFSADKKHVLNSINRYFREQNVTQGKNAK